MELEKTIGQGNDGKGQSFRKSPLYMVVILHAFKQHCTII